MMEEGRLLAATFTGSLAIIVLLQGQVARPLAGRCVLLRCGRVGVVVAAAGLRVGVVQISRGHGIERRPVLPRHGERVRGVVTICEGSGQYVSFCKTLREKHKRGKVGWHRTFRAIVLDIRVL